MLPLVQETREALENCLDNLGLPFPVTRFGVKQAPTSGLSRTSLAESHQNEYFEHPYKQKSERN